MRQELICIVMLIPLLGFAQQAEQTKSALNSPAVQSLSTQVSAQEGQVLPKNSMAYQTNPAPKKQESKQKSIGEIEVFGGASFQLQGSEAIVSDPAGFVDSGIHKRLPLIGGSFTGWVTRYFGGYFDFSHIDGGEASASTGLTSAKVKSSLLDFHAGVVLQYPGARIRPYVNAGGGLARNSLSSSFNSVVPGLSTTSDINLNTNSVSFGGGIRVFITDNWGVRSGGEAIRLSSAATGGSLTYSRAIAGVFRQF